MAITYGQCPCGGTYEQRWVEVNMTVATQPVVIESVPQGACPVCAGRVYKAADLAAIESRMKGTPVDRRHFEPPR